jgi:hypothetical protein
MNIELPECESFRGRFDGGHQVVRELWRRPKATRFTHRYMKAQLTLAIFDDKLMNGLDFCEKVYDLVENVTNSPNGIEALQLQNSPELKKLVEKLIPLSKYIQGRYGPNRRLKVRWIDGRDGYDAQVLSSGAFLDKRASPRRRWIEITNVVQESNPHLPLPLPKSKRAADV